MGEVSDAYRILVGILNTKRKKNTTQKLGDFRKFGLDSFR
jgi:hypothetical protein